jgi:hypothetical protein
LSTPSLTALKGESVDQSNSTSRENTSTVFDDTFSTKVETAKLFQQWLKTATFSTRKVEKIAMRDA